jgi:hypothetical protein
MKYEIIVHDVPRAIFDLEPYSKSYIAPRLVRPERGERASGFFFYSNEATFELRQGVKEKKEALRCVAQPARNAWFWPINSKRRREKEKFALLRKYDLRCDGAARET